MAEHMQKTDLLKKFEELGISAHTVEHEEVFTVEQALSVTKQLEPALFAKNLFLRDKKKSLWLFCAPHFADVKLNDLAKEVGAPGGLRFADEETLYNTLGVRQGCVTVFGLINDHEHRVRLILDRRFWDEDGQSGGKKDPVGDGGGSSGAQDSAKLSDGNPQLDGDADAASTGDSESERMMYFHPLVNSASTGVTVKGLKAFLKYTGHIPLIV